MSNTFSLLGQTFTNVAGFKQPDSDGVVQTFTVGGGGSSNVVSGTFTTGSAGAGIETVSIAYAGSGYPIAIIVSTLDGPFGPDTSASTTSYCTYLLMAFRRQLDESVSGAVAITTIRTGSGTNYKGTNNRVIFTSADPGTAAGEGVTLDGSTLKYRVRAESGSTYGLIPSTTYRYYIVYEE